MRIKMEPIGLNVDLLRPGFNLQRFTENVLMQEARALEVDMNVITQTWSKIPTVNIIKKRFDDVWIYWENDVIGWLNDGTNAHWVQPKKAAALAFPGGPYTAKSMVGRIASRAGGGSGPIAFSKGHYVKGIKARNWDDEFEKKYSKLLPKRFERALLAELTMR